MSSEGWTGFEEALKAFERAISYEWSRGVVDPRNVITIVSIYGGTRIAGVMDFNMQVRADPFYLF